MTRPLVLAIACILPACAALAAPPEAPATGRAWERYETIVNNNIFLKDRRPPRSADDADRPVERPVYRVERDLLLTGIGRQGERFTAFIEDLRSNSTQRLTTGDDVGGGRIDAIALDHLIYAEGDSRLRVEIGQTLAGDGASGGSAASGGEPSAEPSGGSTTTTPTPGLDPEDEKAILERLRQQRLKELNKP